MADALASTVDQPTGLESTIPQYDGTNEQELLDYIMGYGGDYIPRRPDVYSGWVVDEETGQAYTAYEVMSNDERKAAWDEWYQAADAYGFENLNGSDGMAYVATGYRLGHLTAEEADALYDEAWANAAAANGWELQDDGVTWRRERDGAAGRTIVETRTQPSFADGYFGESGAWDGSLGESLGPGSWTDHNLNPLNHQENYTRVVEDATGLQGLFAKVTSQVLPVVVKGALSWAVGQALGPLIVGKLTAAGLSTAQATALSSAISSQVANGLINGEVSLESALTAGLGSYLSAGGLSELLGDSAEALNGFTESLKEAMQLGTGSEFIGAMVQAGGTNILMQYATTGEVDPLLLASALAQAGLINEMGAVVKQGLDSGNLEEDEFYQWLKEDEAMAAAFENANWIVDANNNGIADAGDLQEITVDAEYLNGLDQGYGQPEFSTTGRYYVDENGTIFSSRDITFGDYNGETTMFVNGEPVGWMDEVRYTSDGRFVTAKPWQELGMTEAEWDGLSADQQQQAITNLESVEYDALYNPATNEIEFVDKGINQIKDGAANTVLGDDLVGAPSGNANPGDYVNSQGQTVRYYGTIYGAVDDNGNWYAGSPGQEQDIYWNADTQTYETESGVVVDFETLPEDVVKQQPNDTSTPQSDPVNNTDNTLIGGSDNAGGGDGSPSPNVDVNVGGGTNTNNNTNLPGVPGGDNGDTPAGGTPNPGNSTPGGQNNETPGPGGTNSEATGPSGDNNVGDNGVGTNPNGTQGTGNQDTGAGDDDSGAGDPGIGAGPGGSGLGGNGLMAGLAAGGNNENINWGPLFEVGSITPWKKYRHQIYNSLNDGLMAAAQKRRAV
jgi:hypothetical protein